MNAAVAVAHCPPLPADRPLDQIKLNRRSRRSASRVTAGWSGRPAGGRGPRRGAQQRLHVDLQAADSAVWDAPRIGSSLLQRLEVFDEIAALGVGQRQVQPLLVPGDHGRKVLGTAVVEIGAVLEEAAERRGAIALGGATRRVSRISATSAGSWSTGLPLVPTSVRVEPWWQRAQVALRSNTCRPRLAATASKLDADGFGASRLS